MLDTLRQVADSREEVESVFHIVARLSQDVGKYQYLPYEPIGRYLGRRRTYLPVYISGL